MGLFWAYFRDTLRLPFILKRGALALLAEGGATLLDAARGVIVSLRDQFCPERCEEAFLANFARSRGMVRAPQEPDTHWNARVRFAYHWWVRGGRSSTMAQVLVDYFGFASVEIINLRAEDSTRWAEFRIVADVVGSDLMFGDDQIQWAINEIKPARSKLAGIDYVYSVIGHVPAYSFGCISAEVIEVFGPVVAGGGVEGLTDELIPGEVLTNETTGEVLTDELNNTPPG
jgi:hypothetical protein